MEIDEIYIVMTNGNLRAIYMHDKLAIEKAKNFVKKNKHSSVQVLQWNLDKQQDKVIWRYEGWKRK